MSPKQANNKSIWENRALDRRYHSLAQDLEVDVAIIGAGITGLTAAYQLKKHGKTVAILDQSRIGSGTSGKTTAHLTTLLDHTYDVLESKYGEDVCRLIAKSLRESIDRIETMVDALHIDCDFRRLSGFYYTEEEKKIQDVHKVFSATKRAGLDVIEASRAPLPFTSLAAFEIKNQAQFHIMKYLTRVASAVVGDGVHLFEDTRVVGVDSGKPCRVRTDQATVFAKDVIMATHTPLGFNILQTVVAPYRSYVIAAKVRNDIPDGLFWDTCEPYHYIRGQKTDSEAFVIIGGKDRKVGHGGEEAAFADLLAYATHRFDVKEIICQWSAQLYEPADHLPFIGPIPFSDHVYTGTGYSGDGITLGTLAGYMMAEQIAGRSTPYDHLFRPSRINFEGLPTFFRENLDIAKGLILDRLLPAASSHLESMQLGEGRVFRSGATKFAAYRDESGDIDVFSAICPHMKCVVRWNHAQKSFDCPCHGSRFDTAGHVLEGPSLHGLAKIDKSASMNKVADTGEKKRATP